MLLIFSIIISIIILFKTPKIKSGDKVGVIGCRFVGAFIVFIVYRLLLLGFIPLILAPIGFVVGIVLILKPCYIEGYVDEEEEQ